MNAVSVMKIRLPLLLVNLIGLCCGCSKPPDVAKTSQVNSPASTSAEFVTEYIRVLKKESPELTVTRKGDLELDVKDAAGHSIQVFLDNAFAGWKQDPAAGSEVIRNYVKSTLENLTEVSQTEKVDPTRIVPVIKDRAWVPEVSKSLQKRGTEKPPQNIVDEFCGDLVIVYAEDTDKNIRYLTADLLKDTGIDRAALRKLAIENIDRLLPSIQRQGAGGTYMVTAGGTYEACLLLINSVWKKETFDVQGDIVVCVPSRDLLLVTGSEDQAGLEKVRKLAADTITNGQYPLTASLFVFRDGEFQPFHP